MSQLDGASVHRTLADAYLRAERGKRLAIMGFSAVFDTLWLSLLNDAQLAAVNTRYYDKRPMYYDRGYNDSGLFPWEQDVVDRHVPRQARLTVTAAGAGREVIALARAGYDVSGFEPHAGL